MTRKNSVAQKDEDKKNKKYLVDKSINTYFY